MTTTIRLISDLHIEFCPYIITNPDNVDTLILAGDILLAQALHNNPEESIPSWKNTTELRASQLLALQSRELISDASRLYKHVICIAGNHEFYQGKFHTGLDYLRDEYSKYPNVHFLEDETVTLDGVKFIGSTLWTDMNKGDALTLWQIKKLMNDYHVIMDDSKGYGKLQPEATLNRHYESLKYLTTELQNSKDDKVVVVTHHLPTYQSVPEKYKNDKIINGGFVSDLSEIILHNPQIKLWCHGHTHSSCDYMVGETRVVCNPRGYASKNKTENTDWNEYIIIEV